MAVTLLVSVSTAFAQGPVWKIDSLANTTAAPGSTLDYLVQVSNVGGADSDGTEFDVTVSLPPGMTAVSYRNAPVLSPFSAFSCTGPGGSDVAGQSVITCADMAVVTSSQSDPSFQAFILTVAIDSGMSPGVVTSSLDVSGGGADPTSTVDPTTITPTLLGFGVDAFDGQVSGLSGNPFTQAGGHPYAASTTIDFNTITHPNPVIGPLWPVAPTKDVLVDLPPGFIGNPTGAAKCTPSDLANGGIEPLPLCPPASQVGTALVHLTNPVGSAVFGPLPVFNLAPPQGVPARFGFNIAGTLVTLDAALRSGTDYGLSVNVRNISEGLSVAGTSLTFWGVPSDPSHDTDRACPGRPNPWRGGPSCPSGAARVAFLRNPTSCTGEGVGLPTTTHIDSWSDPGTFEDAMFFSHVPPAYPAPPAAWGSQQGPTGCDAVPFGPSLTATPVTPVWAANPSGFSFDVVSPQTDDPDVVGEADLKNAVVTLPEGVRISASSADGLGACSPEQVALHLSADSTCPGDSKVGTLKIHTPLLDEPLTGSIYVATPHRNPFNALVAIYLVAKGPGLIVKLAGKVELDPVTGRIKTTFDGNPQLPFSLLHLEFDGGPRAPLMTPPTCGVYETHAVLNSWSGKTVSSVSRFTVDADSDGGACAPLGFAPRFVAGTDNPIAGRESSFRLSLSRRDQDQELRSVAVDMPHGVLARIVNTDLCSARDASAGSCTNASKIGSVTVGAGAGTNPFYVSNGRVYITSGYKGAPFGLSIVVPAVAGPFDLGDVVVRAAVFVDRHTAALRVVADPLPVILQGIPLDVRVVRVSIDKPTFIINPTSCAVKRVAGLIGSTAGVVAHVAARFEVTDCGGLAFAPKIKLGVGARHRTRAGVSTPLTTTLTQTRGQSNLRAVSVDLPTTLNALLPVVNRACRLAEFEAGHCAKAARVGSAVALTPLLRNPLRGSVYFVKNAARAVPDLMIALRGQVKLDLTGKISIPGGKRLAATFDTIPDAPITRFTLRLVAGKNGPLGTTVDLCTSKARSPTATIGFLGQNGKRLRVKRRLDIAGCARATRRRTKR